MLSISKQTSYSLLLIYHLRDKSKLVSLEKLSKHANMPERYLARIAAELVKENVLISKEGRGGGYRLARKLKDINLYSFLKIFEKDIEIVNCQKKGVHCNWEKLCGHKSFFTNRISNIFIKQLKRYTLKDVFKD